MLSYTLRLKNSSLIQCKHLLRPLTMALFLLWLAAPTWLHSETLSGTIEDQSGAVIAGARIEVSGDGLAQPIVLVSDGLGKFSSSDLKPGTYSLRVTREGFEPLSKTVELRGDMQLELKLAIAQQRVEITVPGKNLAFANSDPLYRKLRDIGLGKTFRLDNFTLQLDTATFQFQKGTLTVLSPVNGDVTGAIYSGEGHFSLKPITVLDANELKRRTGTGQADEDFTEVVFRFTGQERLRFMPGLGEEVEPPPDVAAILEYWKERMRKRQDQPLGFTEAILHGDTMDNVDADVLAALYNPSHPPFFNAYIHGKKHKDLRYFVRTRVGALPQLDSPEEVALINYDPEGMDDGVWYLAHLKSEYVKGTASSQERPPAVCNTRLQDRDNHCKERSSIQYCHHYLPAARPGRESSQVRIIAKSPRRARHGCAGAGPLFHSGKPKRRWFLLRDSYQSAGTGQGIFYYCAI